MSEPTHRSEANLAFSLMVSSIQRWIIASLGLSTVSEDLKTANQKITQTQLAVIELSQALSKLEGYLMALPEIVKTAIATEFEQGTKREALITELKAKVTELETRPELKEDEVIVNIKDLVAEIEKINPTPLSDVVVDEVKNNPEIETPDSVEEAPETAPDVIQSPDVVSDAIDAIVSAE